MRLLVLVSLTFMTMSIYAGQQYYRITDIGALLPDSPSVASSINNLGQVVGYYSGDNYAGAYSYSLSTGVVKMLDQYSQVRPHFINDSNQIVGRYFVPVDSVGENNYFSGFVANTNKHLNSIGHIHVINSIDYGEALGINKSGTVVGWSSAPSLIPDYIIDSNRAWTWSPNGGLSMLPLPNGVTGIDLTIGTSINDGGLVAGYYMLETGSIEGVFWDPNGNLTFLGNFSDVSSSAIHDTQPMGINNVGKIVGTTFGNSGYQAFIWSSSAGMTTLGSSLDNYYESRGYSINSLGQVVGTRKNASGTHVFLWSNGNQAQDLGNLISPKDPLYKKISIEIVHQINDLGQIVGEGYVGDGTVKHALLLTLDSQQSKHNDFNGDGISDLVWRQASTGTIGILFMSNTGMAASWQGIATDTGWNVVGTGDFNGDGIPDLLWRQTSTGLLGELFMNSNGTIKSWNGLSTGTDWNVVDTADFNGDGISDLVWRQASTGTIGILFMSNTGAAASWQGIATDTGWNVVGTGDFNGDGIPDLLWRQTSTGLLGELFMNSNGTIKSWNGLSTGTDWNVVDTADFNGDGISDLVWRQASTGTIGILFMSNTGAAASWQGIATDTGWNVVGTGDFNGDGIPDLLWRQTSTGLLGELFMNSNGTIKSWNGLSTGTDWNVTEK